MNPREKERQRLLKEARRIKAEIEQYGRDSASWNENRPNDYIDGDPDLEVMFNYFRICDMIKELEDQGVQS